MLGRPIAVLSSLILAAGTLSGCNPFESRLIGLCEAALKDRLASPSSYRRIEAKQYTEELSIDDYRAERLKSIAKEDTTVTRKYLTMILDEETAKLTATRRSPARLEVYLTYDAPNAFGVPLRLHSTCTFLTADQTADKATEGDVVVDGMTKLESLVDRIRKSRELAE